MKSAKAGLYDRVFGVEIGVGLIMEVGGEVRNARAEMVVGKEVMNGV
jgi:hypothetical protein